MDTTILYTGIDKLTLAANFDFAGEENDPELVALGTRKSNESRWGGIAAYAATIEYRIWRGLVGRLEYRHDEANR